jgi:hypothetical protein
MSFPGNQASKDQVFSEHGNSQFIIGRDLQGRWIVAEALRRAGGIFISQEAALKYAATEWGQRPEMLRWSNEPLVLWNFNGDAASQKKEDWDRGRRSG